MAELFLNLYRNDFIRNTLGCKLLLLLDENDGKNHKQSKSKYYGSANGIKKNYSAN